MKHTPGPWYAHNLWLGPDSKGPYSYPLGTDPEQAAANARLIAAAPDLLQALQAVMPHVGAAPAGFDILIDQARAAIRKATGE